MRKKYWEMNTEELAKATKQFDLPLVANEARALTAEEKVQWQRAKRKRGRPKVGKGFKRISISLEQGLLDRVTAYARKQSVPRSKFLADVVEAALAKADDGSSR